MTIPFKRIWSLKRYDLKQWLFYNVLIALSPVWMACFILMFGNVFDQFSKTLLDGTFLVFSATISGASMSFFVTETKLNLRKTEQFIFNGLLLAVFLGVSGYSAIVILKQFSPANMAELLVKAFTVFTVALSVYFNLYLAGVRSVYSDEKSMSQLIEEDALGQAIEDKELAEKAHNAESVDGAKL